MNILEAIQRKKAEFQNASVERRRANAIIDTQRAIEERQRLERIQQVESVKMQEQEKLARVRASVEKSRGPSKVQAFGKNLAKVMNKGKEGLSKMRSQGNFKGLDVGGSSSQSSVFGGQKPLDVGGQGLFSREPTPKIKPKSTTIIIKQ